jgi:hypothetical protein
MATRYSFADLVRNATAKSGTGDVMVDRDMEVEDQILVFDQAGVRIRGAHGHRPVLYWTGAAHSMLDFANCRDTLIENLCVEAHGRLDTVFHYWRKVRGRTTPTNNKHRGISCLVRPGGELRRFASQDNYSDDGSHTGLDENNEFGLYEDIDVDGAFDGIRFLGQQSHGHVLTRCRLNVKNDGVVSTGWFSATDVSGSGLSGAAFHVVGISAPIQIVRPNFEAVKRLLVAEGSEGATGDSQPIFISGGSTRCDQLAIDGNLIDIRHRGPLAIRNHQFGSGQQPVPHIRTWWPGIVTVEDCSVGSWDSHGKDLVRRYDGSGDPSSPVRRTWLHTQAGHPIACPGWHP